MVEYTLTLPLLAGVGRDALRIVGAAGLPADLCHSHVRVSAASTLAGTESFADELIRTLLVRRSAARLTVIDVGAHLGQMLAAAAREHHLDERVSSVVGPFQPSS